MAAASRCNVPDRSYGSRHSRVLRTKLYNSRHGFHRCNQARIENARSCKEHSFADYHRPNFCFRSIADIRSRGRKPVSDRRFVDDDLGVGWITLQLLTKAPDGDTQIFRLALLRGAPGRPE